MVVQGAVLRIVPLLATKVASIRPHSAHSGVFPPTFSAYGVVIVIALFPAVILLLRVISLLTLASKNFLLLFLPNCLELWAELLVWPFWFDSVL